MDNEKIARELIDLAKSIEGKNGMKRNAGGWERDYVDIKKLADDLEVIENRAVKEAYQKALVKMKRIKKIDEIDYKWAKEVNIKIRYGGGFKKKPNGDERTIEPSISYKIREDGIEIEYR